MWESTDLCVQGVRSTVYQAGNPRAQQAVVLVHGNPGPAEDWEKIARDVGTFARVIAPDMPGFGRADHPRHFDFRIEGYASHLAGLLERLAVSRVHLVAHDFGAAWAAQWAVEHPEAAASLTLINPLPLCDDYRWHTFARIWQTPLLGELLQAFSGRRSITYVMNRDNPQRFPQAFTDRVCAYADWNQKMAVAQLYRSCTDVQTTLGALGARLAALGLETCLIWGTGDRYVPTRYAQAMSRLLCAAELHLLDGLGHWPFIDAPERVSALICAFLRRQMPLRASA